MLLPFTENSIFGAVVGVGSVESSYLIQYVPCNVSHTHPDLPALLVLLQYLSQLEVLEIYFYLTVEVLKPCVMRPTTHFLHPQTFSLLLDNQALVAFSITI